MARKNFIWLIFDSIRGDRTSVGGHDRETTPTLEAIGSRDDGLAGTCFSHAIWSQPSVASMMTGTSLSRHGSGSFNETLPEGLPTVADRLSAVGYRTVGVSSNPFFSSTTGLHRGFDRFDFVSGAGLAREAGARSLLSFLRNVRTFSGGFTLDKRKHTPDFLLNRIVADRIEQYTKQDSPLFLAAHYYGAHHPYYPSPAFRSAFTADLPMGADEATEVAFEHTTDVYSTIARGGFEDESVQRAIEAMYDAQVRQVDALVERLITFIERLGIGDDTILVVTSDHGDLLGELGLFSHKLLLHDALIEVPVAVRGSEYLAGSETGLAQHADIMQTILAELDADTTGMQGCRLDETPRRMAVAQRGGQTHEKTLDEVGEYAPGFGHEHVPSGFATALRTDDWKYISAADEARLYRLPVETEDVASDHPDVVGKFEARFEEWMDSHGEPVESTKSIEFDESVQEHLADLGYVVE